MISIIYSPSYPISYDYINIIKVIDQNLTIYILYFISDLFNYFIFVIVNFAIDIGMIVKLRQTLNEKLEKSKEYTTKTQQEKSRLENETVLNKTRSMIIWNISLNLLLKLPATSYSIIYLYSVYINQIRNMFWSILGLQVFLSIFVPMDIFAVQFFNLQIFSIYFIFLFSCSFISIMTRNSLSHFIIYFLIRKFQINRSFFIFYFYLINYSIFLIKIKSTFINFVF